MYDLRVHGRLTRLMTEELQKQTPQRSKAMELQSGDNVLLMCAVYVFVVDSEALWVSSQISRFGELHKFIFVTSCFLAPAFVLLCFSELIKLGLTWKRCMALVLSVMALAEVVILFHDRISTTPFLRHT